MSVRFRPALYVLALVAAVVFLWWSAADLGSATRGEPLQAALRPLQQEAGDRGLAARIILGNYQETRTNAARWSGVYWGFTFLAAALSAFAALVLKLESIVTDQARKKDIAATCSVLAALLITVNTGGEFQGKWQANRLASAELERIGYDYLEKSGENPRAYLAAVGQVLNNRHLAILGAKKDPR